MYNRVDIITKKQKWEKRRRLGWVFHKQQGWGHWWGLLVKPSAWRICFYQSKLEKKSNLSPCLGRVSVSQGTEEKTHGDSGLGSQKGPSPLEATLPLGAQKLPGFHKKQVVALSILPYFVRWRRERQEDPWDEQWHLYPPPGQLEGLAGVPCGCKATDDQWPGGGHRLGGALEPGFQRASSPELLVCPPHRGWGWDPNSHGEFTSFMA